MLCFLLTVFINKKFCKLQKMLFGYIVIKVLNEQHNEKPFKFKKKSYLIQ